MRTSLSAQALGFKAKDKIRLFKALKKVTELRWYRRLQAVWLVAKGRKLAEVADITPFGLRSVYRLVKCYLKAHRVEALAEKSRSGRPLQASELTRSQILRELQRSPWRLGYRTTVWTVKALADRLNKRYQCAIGPWALGQRMKQIGLTCKRPRHAYSEKAPHLAQKKGGDRAQTQEHAAPCRMAV